jgi:hypothetical protein
MAKRKDEEAAIIDELTQVTVAAADETTIDEELAFWELDPDNCADDLIINTTERPLTLPVKEDDDKVAGYTTRTLYQGDRIKGKYYRELVTKHNIAGIQLCNKLPKDYLIELDIIRKSRLKHIPEEEAQQRLMKIRSVRHQRTIAGGLASGQRR